MSSDCQLKVGGKSYGGWTSIEVNTGVDRLSGDFDLSVVELWADGAQPLQIPKGSSFSLALEGTTVMSGFTNTRNVAYDDKQHSTTLKGRDRAQDLVDCSAISSSGSWFDATMDKIVADLIKPHGIKLTVATDVGRPFPRWQITGGESIHDNIDRMARQRGVLVISDGLGGIIIKQPSAAKIKTPLILGQNIKSCESTDDDKDRFHTYVVTGQPEFLQQGTYSDVLGTVGQASDGAIRSNRVLVVHAEEGFDASTFQKRAQWEASYRYGRSLSIDYEVKGWSHANGVWLRDNNVRVQDPFVGIDQWLYIAGVKYRIDDKGGKVTRLRLTHREAFMLIPIPVKGDFGA